VHKVRTSGPIWLCWFVLMGKHFFFFWWFSLIHLSLLCFLHWHVMWGATSMYGTKQ
jgi:hypothetical protein